MLRLRVGDKTHVACRGDTVWIPEGTAIVYESSVRTKFFYAVCPAQNSISTKEPKHFTQAAPYTSADDMTVSLSTDLLQDTKAL